jgi:hypothetical protein
MSSADDTLPRWSKWREIPAVVSHRRYLKRTVTIALCVGTVFFAINQLAAVLADHATLLTWLKVAITYLTPFCMSNFGIITATRTPEESCLPSHV